MRLLSRARDWLRGFGRRNGGSGPIGTRATVFALAEEPADVAAAEAWIEQRRDRLSVVSNQLGCGCCILMWDVEGPAEVIATLPESLQCDSEWTRSPSAPFRLH